MLLLFCAIAACCAWQPVRAYLIISMYVHIYLGMGLASAYCTFAMFGGTVAWKVPFMLDGSVHGAWFGGRAVLWASGVRALVAGILVLCSCAGTAVWHGGVRGVLRTPACGLCVLRRLAPPGSLRG